MMLLAHSSDTQGIIKRYAEHPNTFNQLALQLLIKKEEIKARTTCLQLSYSGGIKDQDVFQNLWAIVTGGNKAQSTVNLPVDAATLYEQAKKVFGITSDDEIVP